MGNPYPNHKGNYYYRNHTLYHIGTLDPLGLPSFQAPRKAGAFRPQTCSPKLRLHVVKSLEFGGLGFRVCVCIVIGVFGFWLESAMPEIRQILFRLIDETCHIAMVSSNLSL